MMQRILNVELHQLETDEKVNRILKTIEANSPKLLTEQIFATGCVWDAYTYVCDLIRSAEKRLVLIDNYVDERVLTMLDKRKPGVDATVHTRYTDQVKLDFEKHNKQYEAIEMTRNSPLPPRQKTALQELLIFEEAS